MEINKAHIFLKGKKVADITPGLKGVQVKINHGDSKEKPVSVTLAYKDQISFRKAIIEHKIAMKSTKFDLMLQYEDQVFNRTRVYHFPSCVVSEAFSNEFVLSTDVFANEFGDYVIADGIPSMVEGKGSYIFITDDDSICLGIAQGDNATEALSNLCLAFGLDNLEAVVKGYKLTGIAPAIVAELP